MRSRRGSGDRPVSSDHVSGSQDGEESSHAQGTTSSLGRDQQGVSESESSHYDRSKSYPTSPKRTLDPPFSPNRTSFDSDTETTTLNDRTSTRSNDEEEQGSDPEKPSSWASLPKKSQLAILTFARLSEPLSQTSFQAYMFYQLKSFDPSLPDSTISTQTGILQGCFTIAQFFTAVLWGRLADTAFMGRKKVLLIGLLGTCVASVGYGFSKSFVAAAVFRTMAGLLNSNMGVMRTMVSEIVEEKKHQSRAFLLLPMCFNVGVIIGPIFGGLLADPIQSYPNIFGPGSLIGGKQGVWWMRQWPYALPNMIIAIFIFVAAIAIFLGLDETHEIARYKPDWGRQLYRTLTRCAQGRAEYKYQPLDGAVDPDTVGSIDLDRSAYSSSAPASPTASRAKKSQRKRLPFRTVWTRNVLLTLLTHFFLAIHVSAFNALTFAFLPSPRAPNSQQGFFRFGGGLGMPSSRVGLATSIIGVIGLPLQIFIYPRVQFRLGSLKSFRIFLPFSPLAYILAPFLVILPNRDFIVWLALAAVIALQVISRTFSLPAIVILVNNAVPDPSVLATVHGMAQTVSSAARTLGPLAAGWGLGMGLKFNMVGGIWWALALEALLNWALTWTIFEGVDKQKSVEE